MVMHRLAYTDRFANGDPEPLESEECLGTPLVLVSDEVTEVVASFTGEQFTKWLTCFQLGAELLYQGETNQLLYDFLRMVDCPVDICERVAQCLTENNEALINALADAIANNPTLRAAISSAISEMGSGIPGQPLTPEQSSQDTLPENVKDEFGDCQLDELYGAMLFLVRRGDRAIQDFFEIVEEQSNALETSAIVTGAIPAAGDFAQSGFEFADQLLENISEGYAAAYTEEYEIGLACDLFCIAKAGCTLTPDALVSVMAQRLSFGEPGDFGEVMAGVGGAIFPGTNIADTAFYIYFTAMKFGQKFLNTIGFKSLTDQMALGAEQLFSSAWETECDCPTGLIFKVYADFLQTIFVEDIDVELGVEFDIEVDPVNFPYGELVIKPEFSTSYRLTYTASGTILPTIAETAWSYRKPDDEFESDTPGILTDMPSPAEGKLWFWNNAESEDGIGTYTLHITIDLIP